ncbi:MAG TPA: TIGR03617 family F420-dependent LLM class oxidoreductase [Mycobacterium sp.]|nr:TIGR03617 family F420-dependent LLM class oxidoreductase [Mycobacterium sp.]
MDVIASIPADTRLTDVAALARRAESLGFDVLHVPETIRDPFGMCALALEHTSRIVVRTSMALAFPRSPMLTAYAAWELAAFSGGRFELGLATQVRGNIVGRYSALWVDPVAQMRDYVASLRAIFVAFTEQAPLEVELEHYRFTRLQPYFNPGPIDVPAPPIYLGGVNKRMLRLAGAVADGFVCHPTSSHPVTLREHTLPVLLQAAKDAGRAVPRVVVGPKVVTSSTERGLAAEREGGRGELAFLYSTPAYRLQLDLLGHGDVADALVAAASRKDWQHLDGLMTDELMDELVPHCTYADLPQVLAERYSGLCDGIVLALPADAGEDVVLAPAVAGIKGIPKLVRSR